MNQKARLLYLVLPLFFLLPFVVISFYNHPALDDWWYAEAYKQFGLAGAQQYWYNNYTARFFSSFLMTVAPLSFGFTEGHKLMPLIFLMLLYCTFIYIHRAFFKDYSRNKYWMPLWFTVAYLLIQRDYFEGVYWLSANVVYQYTMLYWMLHLTVLYKVYVREENTIGNYFLLMLLSIAATASNETFGGLILAETTLITAYAVSAKKRTTLSIILLLTVVITWAIMFAAPGNWSKIEGATREHIYTFHFFKAIKYNAISVGYYALFLIKQPSVWCLVFLSLPAWKHLFNNALRLNLKNKYLLGSVLCFGVAFVIYFIAIYPTGILISPLRVTNIAVVFLFTAIALMILWLTEKQSWLNKLALLVNNHRMAVMIACLVFAALTPTQYNKLLHDLSTGRAKEYDQQMHSRYNKLRSSTGDTCYVKQLKNVPRSIVASDVSGPVSEKMGLIFGRNYLVKIVE